MFKFSCKEPGGKDDVQEALQAFGDLVNGRDDKIKDYEKGLEEKGSEIQTLKLRLQEEEKKREANHKAMKKMSDVENSRREADLKREKEHKEAADSFKKSLQDAQKKAQDQEEFLKKEIQDLEVSSQNFLLSIQERDKTIMSLENDLSTTRDKKEALERENTELKEKQDNTQDIFISVLNKVEEKNSAEKNQSEKLNDELRKKEHKLLFHNNQLEDATKKKKEAEQKYKQAQGELKNYRRRLEGAEKESLEQKEELSKLKTDLNQANTELEAILRESNQKSQFLDRVNTQLDNVRNKLEEVARQVERQESIIREKELNEWKLHTQLSQFKLRLSQTRRERKPTKSRRIAGDTTTLPRAKNGWRWFTT